MSTTTAESAPLAMTVEFEGAPTPIRDLAWGLFVPCGCIHDITDIDHHDGVLHTPEAAWRHFCELKTAARAKQDAARGWYVQLVRRARALDLTKACGHDPEHGGVYPPRPEGLMWGVTSRGAKAQHLIPDDTKDTAKDFLDKVTALCGEAVCRWQWELAWNANRGRHDCLKCLKAAAAAVARPVADVVVSL